MFLRTSWVSALLLLVSLRYGALAQEKPCVIHDNGKYYDLNPLKSRYYPLRGEVPLTTVMTSWVDLFYLSSKDYQVKTAENQSIWLNVCQNVKTDLFGIKDDSIDAGDVGGFIRRAHGDFVIGKVNTSLSIFDSRPRFVMSGGSRCKPKAGDQTTDIRASSMVEFVCDASVYGVGSPRLLAQLPPGEDEIGCAYVIEWRTHLACPTSEGGGVWGFFAILGIVFLVLLMTYTVLGTLYNRFVLQLRGFDQIPQFSIESMKYHGREAWDWIKDMTAALGLGGLAGRGGGGGGQGYNGIPSGGLHMPNPVSHHSQASGFGRNDDPEENAPLHSSGLGGGAADFMRPQPNRNRSAAFQRMEINPVSHQSQVAAGAQSLSFSPSSASAPSSAPAQSPPPQSRATIQSRRIALDSRIPTSEERDFMLGDDDEDAQELGEVKAPPSLAERSSNASSSSQGSAGGAASAPAAPSPEPNPAAAARGRDLGGGNVTLL